MIDNSNNLETGLNTYSMWDLENECIQEMNSNGIYFEGSLKRDGELYRFSSDRKKNQPDEWYVCTEHGQVVDRSTIIGVMKIVAAWLSRNSMPSRRLKKEGSKKLKKSCKSLLKKG